MRFSVVVGRFMGWDFTAGDRAMGFITTGICTHGVAFVGGFLGLGTNTKKRLLAQLFLVTSEHIYIDAMYGLIYSYRHSCMETRESRDDVSSNLYDTGGDRLETPKISSYPIRKILYCSHSVKIFGEESLPSLYSFWPPSIQSLDLGKPYLIITHFII